MNSNQRLFLCGMTYYKEYDKIVELVNLTKDYVDGFCWTVDDNNHEEVYKF